MTSSDSETISNTSEHMNVDNNENDNVYVDNNESNNANMNANNKAQGPAIPAQQSNADPNFLFSQQNSKWTTVKNKRKRSPNHQQFQQFQQTKLTKYWLGTTQQETTANRFSDLVDTEDEEQNPPTVVKVSKPPPIFVDYVENIAPLQQLLKEVAKDNYELKVMSNNRVRVQSQTTEIYSKIVKELEQKETQFHTYEIKENRAFRVVLKQMHHTTDTEELKEVLKTYGHEARNIHNIKKRETKKPLPMFFVDLEPKPNNKDIYKLELLMNLRVKFEPPHQRREIPQCMRCQRYNHTQRFCRHSPRCVKCAGNHATEACSRKVKDNAVLCVLCNLNHPANYKGCFVYRELQEKSFPSLRQKQNTPNLQTSQSAHVRPNVSYAQAAREKSQQAQFLNNVQQSHTTGTQQSNDMLELKQMMKGLMEQMGTMLNLLTTLVSKMN